LKLKNNFVVLHLAYPNLWKMLQSNGKWARYALSKWRGLCFGFFHKCLVRFWSLSSSTIVFFTFHFNKFNRFWDSAFVAFQNVQNEWEINKI
jgi:hypothetical protein